MKRKIKLEVSKEFEEALESFSKRHKITKEKALNRALTIIPIIEAHQDKKLVLVGKEGNITEIDGI